MNQKAKTMLAMILPICGAAIWIPQLMGAGGEAKPMNIDEIPAEADFSASAEFESESPDSDSARPSHHGFDSPTPESDPIRQSDTELSGASEEQSSPSQRAFEAIERIESSRSSTGMAELASLWEEDDESSEETVSSNDGAGQHLELFDEPGSDPLHGFLNENPLTAVLFGKNARVASLGSHLVREGDLLPLGLARVEKIASRYVVLSREDEELRVDLPPFQSRPRAKASESSESDADEGEEPLLFDREEDAVVSEVTNSTEPSSNGTDK